MNIDLFVQELSKQREKYRSLLELTRQQQAIIESGNPDALIQLAERKRAVLDEIEVVDKGISDWKRQWKTIRQGLVPADIARVDTVVDEITTALQELIKIEDASRKTGVEKRGQAVEQMKEVKRKGQISEAYRPKSEDGPSFIDTDQ